MSINAFFTVYYPLDLEIHVENLNSLNNQTNHDFHLFIVNDGVENLDKLVERYYKYPVTILQFDGDMFEIREKGISFILESGYENIIFGDSDDYFSENRIECTLQHLKENDLIVNDVALVDKHSNPLKECYFSNRLANNFKITKEFLIDKNIIGFSNSAIKAMFLKNVSYKTQSLALDWFVFLQVFEKAEINAKFITNCTTYYRQHDNNIADIDRFTPEKFLKGLSVKSNHYNSLSSLFPSYQLLATNAKDLLEKCTDNHFLEIYFDKINSLNITNPFWWERIKLK